MFLEETKICNNVANTTIYACRPTIEAVLKHKTKYQSVASQEFYSKNILTSAVDSETHFKIAILDQFQLDLTIIYQDTVT